MIQKILLSKGKGCIHADEVIYSWENFSNNFNLQYLVG